MTTMRAPAAWRRRLAPSCRRPQAEPAERPDRADPRLGDRRRRRARGPVRPAPHRLRRLHRVGPLALVHRGLHPRPGAADVRQHAHRGVGDRPADDRAARGGARRSSTGPSTAADDDVVVFCGSGATGAIDKLIRAAASSSARRAAGRLHRALRAPLQRAAVARVGRRRRHDPRGRRGPRRPRAPRARAAPPRRPAAEDRQLLGRVERDRDRDRRRRGRDRAAPPRRAVVLGLRRRRPVPADRHERRAGRSRTGPRLQGRGLRLAAQVRRRPRHAGRAGGQALRCCATASRRCPAAGRSCSSARPGTPTTPTRRSARRAARPAIVESIRAGLVFALKEAVGSRRDPPPRARLRPARARARGARTRRSRSSATRSSSASRSSRSACATRAGLLHSNFVVAVLNDLFGIQARSGCFCAGPYIHRMYPIDDAWSRRMDAEVGQGPPGREARLHPAQLQLLHQRGGLRLHRRRRPPGRRRGLEAAAALPLRSRHRAVAPPRRHGPRCAEPRLRGALDGTPPRFATAPESVLAGHLEAARRIIAAMRRAAAGRAARTTRR